METGAFFLLLWDKGAEVLWLKGDAIEIPEEFSYQEHKLLQQTEEFTSAPIG